jgi:thioredoxin reductase
VCKSDGSVWLLDPPFGILGFYEGYMTRPELSTNVYRVDGKTGQLSVAAGDVNPPNGIAFLPDESTVYIVEGGTSARSVLAYDVLDGGTRITNKRKLIDAGPGTPDGFRCDVDGNLWRGVSTCATCDGFFFKDQNIMVVGGGDSAMEEALYLSRLGRQVQVVHRRDSLRASKIMQERALKNPKIEFVWDTAVEDVLDPAKGKVTAVRLKNLKTGAQWETPVDGLFVAIGHQPNTAIFKGKIDLHPNDYVKVTPGTTQTSVPGVFAAGDVADFTYRQAVTAAGTGCMAALEAERYLEAHHSGH